MRHRIGGITGIGNPEPDFLVNNMLIGKTLADGFCKELVETFNVMKKYGGCDFFKTESGCYFGIEPAYEGDPLEIVYIDFKDKGDCYWRKGIAMGAYGSKVVSKYRLYGEYKYKAKFVKFIDKWYDKVRGELCKDT